MWPGNRLGTARAGFAAGCGTGTRAADDDDIIGSGIAAARRR
jgi:hypothetical protein